MPKTWEKPDYLGSRYERPEKESDESARRYGDDQRRLLENRRILESVSVGN